MTMVEPEVRLRDDVLARWPASRRIRATILTMLALHAVGGANVAPAQETPLETAIDSIVQAEGLDHGVPGVGVSVVADGEVSFQRAYGTTGWPRSTFSRGGSPTSACAETPAAFHRPRTCERDTPREKAPSEDQFPSIHVVDEAFAGIRARPGSDLRTHRFARDRCGGACRPRVR